MVYLCILWNKKHRFVANEDGNKASKPKTNKKEIKKIKVGKLDKPPVQQSAGGSIGELALEGFTHAIPWLGKKAVEMSRFGISEAMRNKNLQKKAINYGLNKLTPMIQNVGSEALDKLSTKIRPNIKLIDLI